MALAQGLVHSVGGVADHRGPPMGVAVEGKLYGGVVSEVLDILRYRVRVSSIVKKLCLC